MRKIKQITIICLLFSGITCVAQNNEMKNIEKVITEFSKAGDENNTEKLDSLLDNNYRIVMNRMFGSTEVAIMSKSVYLEKIRSKEYGGDNRVLTFDNIVVNGTTASAKVIFEGTKMTFVSLLDLIEDSDGNWKLVSDTPIIK